MDQHTLDLLLVQQKKKYLRLNEVMDTTVQLADALGRDDEVSARMLLAMREEPIQEIDNAQRCIRRILCSLPSEEQEHLRVLMIGSGREKPHAGEEALDGESQKNYRLLTRILALDKPLNRKIAKEKSFYQD